MLLLVVIMAGCFIAAITNASGSNNPALAAQATLFHHAPGCGRSRTIDASAPPCRTVSVAILDRYKTRYDSDVVVRWPDGHATTITLWHLSTNTGKTIDDAAEPGDRARVQVWEQKPTQVWVNGAHYYTNDTPDANYQREQAAVPRSLIGGVIALVLLIALLVVRRPVDKGPPPWAEEEHASS